MSQMNEWVRNFASVFNAIECSGEDLYGNSLAGDVANNVDPTSFFVAKNVTDSEDEYNFGQSASVSSTSDSYYQLTGATFAVSKVMTADARRMSTTATLGDVNTESHDIVDLLKKIKDDKNTMSFRGCSSSEFLQCVLSDMALNANSANNFRDNCENISGAITNQKLSVSGVDEDEEAIDLVKFQNAYNLSSKMIQVMTEIYDRLILQTGV
jgi:flagellar hook-associated protein 1 FlgK